VFIWPFTGVDINMSKILMKFITFILCYGNVMIKLLSPIAIYTLNKDEYAIILRVNCST
jgi:hypothetical protein